MLNRLFEAFRSTDLPALEAFHRAEMRDAGVTDHAFRAFVNGR